MHDSKKNLLSVAISVQLTLRFEEQSSSLLFGTKMGVCFGIELCSLRLPNPQKATIPGKSEI